MPKEVDPYKQAERWYELAISPQNKEHEEALKKKSLEFFKKVPKTHPQYDWAFVNIQRLNNMITGNIKPVKWPTRLKKLREKAHAESVAESKARAKIKAKAPETSASQYREMGLGAHLVRGLKGIYGDIKNVPGGILKTLTERSKGKIKEEKIFPEVSKPEAPPPRGKVSKGFTAEELREILKGGVPAREQKILERELSRLK